MYILYDLYVLHVHVHIQAHVNISVTVYMYQYVYVCVSINRVEILNKGHIGENSSGCPLLEVSL